METKLLAAIAAIALLSAMLGGFMVQQTAEKSIKEALASQSGMAPAPEAAAQPSISAPSKSTISSSDHKFVGESVLDEQITFTQLPWEKSVNLEQGRYQIYFETDQPIKFMVISNSGSQTKTKATTQFGPKCCDTTGSYTIDINNGEGGEYKIVFDDSELKLADPRPSQGLVQISRSSNI